MCPDTMQRDTCLSHALIGSLTTATFILKEESTFCPLLSTNKNSSSNTQTLSHPDNVTTKHNNNNESITIENCNNNEMRRDTDQSIGEKSLLSINMVEDSTAGHLFNKHMYKHLQHMNKHTLTQNSNFQIKKRDLSIQYDAPLFVSWNWPLIRKCTFFLFLSSLGVICAIVIAIISTLPKNCNPEKIWYRDGVFYEIFPASFQDSNGDGIGDLTGINKRIDYFIKLGISCIRLNSIFDSINYPENYDNVTTLTNIASVLGDLEDIQELIYNLHSHNIALILDLPLNTFIAELEELRIVPDLRKSLENNTYSDRQLMSIVTENTTITKALQYWLNVNVDGFYIKGLDYIKDFNKLYIYLSEWRYIIGSNKILIISESVLSPISNNEQKKSILFNVNLIDVYLNVFSGTQNLEEQLLNVLSTTDFIVDAPTSASLHWSVGGVDHKRLTTSKTNYNFTLAVILLQLMLPGTPSIFYGDEIALQSIFEKQNNQNIEHLDQLAMQWPEFNHTLLLRRQFSIETTLKWMQQFSKMNFDNLPYIIKIIRLRNRSPSIYKNCICKSELVLPNTEIKSRGDSILIIERIYPRRNSFVTIMNLGTKYISLDLTSMYYSGIIQSNYSYDNRIYFSDFQINPQTTIIVKLDK